MKSKTNNLGNPAIIAKAAQNKSVQIGTGIVVVGVVAGTLLFVRSMLQKLNLVDDKDDRAVEKARFTDAFNPIWWKTDPRNKGRFAVFTPTYAQQLAEQINDSITGITNTFGVFAEFTSVMDAFRKARSKMHVSYLAEQYSKKYNMSLYDHLENRLLNSDLAKIVAYVNQLPDRVPFTN